MKSKGWIFKNGVANLGEEFFCFNSANQSQIIWYHEIKQIKLLHKRDRIKSGALTTLAIFLLNVLYFWSPYSQRIQMILAIAASASFLVGFWNPFTEVRIKIIYKTQVAEDFKIEKRKFHKYQEVVRFVQKTIENEQQILSNQMVLHDWSLNAV